MKRGFAGRRVVSVIPENGWRFIKTRDGEEYCVAELMFERGRLIELACYCFDEGGTMHTLPCDCSSGMHSRAIFSCQ